MDVGEVTDRNGDGFVDYLRIVDPPGSYNHRIWVDRDYDGYFDDYPGSGDGRTHDPRSRVPQFEPANESVPTSGDASDER